MKILGRVRERKQAAVPGSTEHSEATAGRSTAQDLGVGSVSERIAAAETLAQSANFHVPPEARDQNQQAAALARPGDGTVPRRLVSAFDSETDHEVRMGIFKALFGVFIDAKEREDLAAIRGLQLTPEDRDTLSFLKDELPRITEAARPDAEALERAEADSR